MRNLKRALSLTLASVMLLGMMVVGSSAAAGYDDVAETDNVEAIEVLQAIEVMVGDERGFGPERPVNRAEMAVVMGKLLSLDYNYYATSCPFDDVYDWARGYVGACYARHIVSGRGEGVYDPGATVTAVEAASMLMRALGYFQYANDVADGFELSTVRQGTIIGIFDGVGSSATEPLTRNQVAQMVLNALQSAVVEPDGNTVNLTTPDGSVLTGRVNYVSVTSAKPFAHAISWTQATSVGSQNDGWIVELGERLYDGKLQLTEDIDVFGRPSRKWEYDGKGIGTYAKKELLDKEYVGKVTGKDLFDLLGSTTLKDYDVYCFIDGVYTEDTGAKAALNDSANNYSAGYYFNAADMNKNNKAAVGGTGTGTVTQVYVDHDDDEVYVVVINTYLAIAKKDYDEKKEEASISAYAIRKDNSIKEYVKVTQPNAKDESFDLAIEDFPAAKDIKKNDPLLITVADGEVQTFKHAETLSGVTISAFKLHDKVVVDGTEYNYTTTAGYKNADDLNQDWTTSTISNLKDRTYNIFLDTYGNLIGVEEIEAKNNYVFITGIDLNGSYRANQTADASAIFLDGTMDSIKVNMTRSEWKVAPQNKPSDSILNTWCTYTKNGDVYTLKEVTPVQADGTGRPGVSNSTKLAQYHQTTKFGGSDVEYKIDAKNYRLIGNPVGAPETYSSVYGDKDTVYLTAKLGDLITSNGNHGIIKDVVSVTTGIDNANLTVWNSAKAITKADDTKVAGAPSAGKSSTGVYTLYNNDGIIIAAVVVGEDAGTAKDLVYVSSASMKLEADNGGSNRASGDGLWTWSRDVVRNGEVVTLYEVGDDSSQADHLRQMKQYHWYQVRTNGEGNVIDAIEAPKALNVYPATGASQYVTDYAKINQAVETQGVDTVLYLTNGGPYKDGKNTLTAGFGKDDELKVEGNNTLAVAHRQGSGIHFKDDVNVVLQYYNRNVKEMDVWAGEGIDDLEDMVDIVNDNSKYRSAAGGEDYYVSALIENGFATTIVIYDSYNDYTRPDDKVPTGKGNVVVAEDFKDNVKAPITVSGDAYISAYGQPVMSFTAKVPAWAAGKATFTCNLFVDGKFVTQAASDALDIDGSQSVSQTVKVFGTITAGIIDPNSTVRVEIVGVTYTARHVRYFAGATSTDKSTQIATASLTNDTDLIATEAAMNSFKVGLKTGVYTGTVAPNALTITGATVGTLASSGNINNNAGVNILDSAQTLAASANDYVDIVITGLTAATPKYDVKVAGSTDAYSKALKDLTVVDLAATSKDKDAVLAITASPAVGAKSVTKGGNVTYTVALTGHLDGIVTGYEVSYTAGGVSGTQTLNGTGSWSFTQIVPNVSADVDFVINSITAKKVTFLMNDKDITVSGDGKTLIIGFTEEIDNTIDAGNITAKDNGGNALTIDSKAVSGGKLVLVFQNALANGDKIDVDAAVFIKGLADTTKPDNRAKQAIITVVKAQASDPYTFTVDSSV